MYIGVFELIPYYNDIRAHMYPFIACDCTRYAYRSLEVFVINQEMLGNLE